jgi:Ca-activated chloride channel family protein
MRLLGIVLVIVALARPQSSEAQETIEGEGVDIVLALDISGSMGALDFGAQNRLEAATQVIDDFVRERPYDRIGLVVFAHNAFLQSPPTLDHRILARQLREVGLATEIGIDDGTAIGLGLATAANMFRDSDVESKVIILLTDGVNNAGEIDPLTAAEAARALGIKVYTVGAGSTGLAPVRGRGLLGDRFVYRESALDEDTLREIAAVTSGRYFRAKDVNGLRQTYSEISNLEKSQVEVQTFIRHEELVARVAFPAMLVLLLEAVLRNTWLRVMP